MISPSAGLYRSRRKELEAAHLAGAGGIEVCLRHSLLVDQLVKSVLETAAGAPRIAIVAVGGYGRQELCFESDIDLLLLVPRLNDEMAAFSKELFYGLLGLGLAVSHAVRTPADCAKMAADIETLTSLLDSRLVAGNALVYRDLERRLQAWVGRRGEQVREQIQDSVEARQAKYRSSAYLFEPQVKEGVGGLRDAHALLWAARGAGLAVGGIGDLATLGVIDPYEADALGRSVDYLLRVRNHLHLSTGKKTDRLLFGQQAELAAFLGLGSNGAEPVEAFMRSYHSQTQRLAYVSRMALRRLRPGLAAAANGAAPAANLAERPEGLMRVFAVAASAGGEIEAGAGRLVRQNLGLVDEGFRHSPAVAGHFLSLFGAEAAPQALNHMLHLGLLEAYIPEFAAIRYLVQHDGYHVSTADVHSVATVEELFRLRAGEYEHSEPVLTGLARETDRFELLALGALLHDIGKGAEEPHAVRGARLVQGIARRLGLADEDAERLSRLVGEHLLLSEAAERHDLGDEDFLRRLTEGLDEGLLEWLYLLTFADSRATGPFSWTAWKSALIQELFFKLEAVLKHRGVGPSPAPEARAGDIATRLAGELDPERVAWHLGQLPAEYLSAVDATMAAEHVLLAEELLRSRQPLTWVARASGHLTALTLCALDRPGLLAKAAGSFALHGLSIHEAVLYTRHDAIAVDTFRLSPVLRTTGPPDWERVMADLGAGLSGKMSLPYRLARRLRPSPLERDDLPGVATKVSVNNDISSLNTVIEVRTRDRVGLLYQLAQAFFELELNICLARVTTKGHQAIDAFFVRDFSGNKVYEPGHIEEIVRAIHFALDGRPGVR